MENRNEVIRLIGEIAEGFRSIADGLQEVCRLAGGDAGRTEQPKISLEQVRGILADKSRAGHTEEIRKVLARYGVDRLSAVDPKHYGEILAEAEGMSDE